MKDYLRALSKRWNVTIALHDCVNNMKMRNLLDMFLLPLACVNYMMQDKNIGECIKGGVSIVAIIKNEGPYLKEWIEYHYRIVGINHFYLYDNDSDDNTCEILRPYIDRGIVTRIEIHGKKRQHDAYNDAINKYKMNTKYMAFIDLDEFIYVHQGRLEEYLDRIIGGRIAAVAINWRIFGSSGRLEKPAGGVLENYTKRGEYNCKPNYHIKTICNPRAVIGMVSAHYAVYKKGYFAVDSDGRKAIGARCIPSNDGNVLLFHYFTKSKAEFESKRLRGKADDGLIRLESEFYEHDLNDVEDTSMIDLIAKYKGE